MYGATDFDFTGVLQDALNKAMEERGHVNILIAGKTGVGKSTLINAVFQGDFATTGQGRPITSKTRRITKEEFPLSIFDTRGLEMAEFESTLESLKQVIQKQARQPDVNEHIHVAWVCITEDSRRVEAGEEALVKMLADFNIPTIAVITKARSDQGFREKVQEILPDVVNAVSVRAIEERLDDDIVLLPKGLEELVKVTFEVVPEGRRKAFTAVQKISIPLKKKQAAAIVATAATTAGTAAAIPIPFSDAFTIVPIQVTMLASVSATFGLPVDQAFLTTLVSGVLGIGGVTLVGRTVVAGLLKLIPGAGSIAGGAISAATAIALTSLLGTAYIATLERLFLTGEGVPPTAEDVAEAFREQYLQLSKQSPEEFQET
jgi:uncharacterized protein (DUF697 family)/GTPase SAR1 family protein